MANFKEVERGEVNAGDLMVLIAFVRRWLRLLALCVGICIAVAVVIKFIVAPTYTAQVTLVPQSSGSNPMGALGSLAIQAGLSIGTPGSYEDIYGRFLESRKLLEPMLAMKWTSVGFSQKTNLYEIFDAIPDGVGSSATSAAKSQLLAKLRGDVISFERNEVTGFMTLKVTVVADPLLAADLANFMVGSLDEYIRRVSTNKARDRRLQLEARLLEMQTELNRSESQLTVFVEQNLNYSTSPSLKSAYRKFERISHANEIVWSELKRQVELARIEENRSVIGIDILDSAVPPAVSDSPSMILAVLIGFFCGLLIWVGFVICISSMSSARPKSY